MMVSKWLNNDYVKFIAFAMRQIERSGTGVLGYITSNSWLDSPTFRGVRTEVMDSFPIIRIVDLHGNIKKEERTPDGSRDEGVFAIEEGTNITLAGMLRQPLSIARVDLLGPVGDGQPGTGKFDWLEHSGINRVDGAIEPTAPLFAMVCGDRDGQSEYDEFCSIIAIQGTYSLGSLTKRDRLTVDFTRAELRGKLNKFRTLQAPEDEIAEIYKVRVADNDGWSIGGARKTLDQIDAALDEWIVEEQFRPFDKRYKIIHPKLIARPNHRVLSNVGDGYPAILLVRQLANLPFDHTFVTERRADQHVISVRTKEGGVVFPLWLKPSTGEPHRRPNIDRLWALDFGIALNLTYEDGIPRGQQGNLGKDFIQPKAEQMGLLDTPWDGRGDLAKTVGPRDLFDYIYAVLHAPTYRSRYAEFLKSDFPRIPTPGTRALFAALVPLGRELVALHLLKPDEAPVLKNPQDIRFAGTGEARVGKGYPEYSNGKVMINDTRWFEDVPKATWEFHVGGYQPCEKWLKDRAAKGGKKQSDGRVLTDEDILHYRRMVVALSETRCLMVEIDKVIEDHGGWPGAFKVGQSTDEGAE